MKKIILCIIGLIVFSIGIAKADVKIDAPLGLSWGMSKEDIEKTGVRIGKRIISDISGMTVIFIHDDSNEFEDFLGKMLIFSDDYGLVSVLFTTMPIKNDPSGTEGKNIYNKYKNRLQEKYGAPYSSIESVNDMTRHKKINSFYECLYYWWCGALYNSKFGNPGETSADITLAIKGNKLYNGSKRYDGSVILEYCSDEYYLIWQNNKEKEKAKSKL